jgi:hypothetical protein
VLQAASIAEELGFSEIAPVVLSDGGNLILHLAPYPIVARIAKAASAEDGDRTCGIVERELRVAHHLHGMRVPVLLPTDLTDAGPHFVAGTWMTLWNYVPPTQLHVPAPHEAVALVHRLSNAMNHFSGELPALGVWNRTRQSAVRLAQCSDQRVLALLRLFSELDQRMSSVPDLLVPCHGDAHARNLIPSSEGWLWMDFEDVSLMPAYWDMASFVGNLALFGGLQEPTFRYMLDQVDIVSDPASFGFAIAARVIMSTLGNLDLALAGNGDLEFATRQLELAEDFLRQLEQSIGIG